jgi:hypothetical protein
MPYSVVSRLGIQWLNRSRHMPYLLATAPSAHAEHGWGF